MRLRLARLVCPTSAEGPGQRLALWVQGCSIRCAGCCNPQLFAAHGGRDVEVEALLRLIRRDRSKIEGVTFLGGEPFEQAAPLAQLGRAVRRWGLSVMTFTGYTLDALRTSGRPEIESLIAATDLLVDGPYDQTQPETARRWAGSRNQRFHFLSRFYSPGVESPPRGDAERTVEVRIRPDGSVEVNGWPERWPGARP